MSPEETTTPCNSCVTRRAALATGEDMSSVLIGQSRMKSGKLVLVVPSNNLDSLSQTPLQRVTCAELAPLFRAFSTRQLLHQFYQTYCLPYLAFSVLRHLSAQSSAPSLTVYLRKRLISSQARQSVHRVLTTSLGCSRDDSTPVYRMGCQMVPKRLKYLIT
jgi:hypothetical protein